MLADEVDYVIGVDTHRDQHTLAVIVAPAGAVLAQTVVGANTGGYSAALRLPTSTLLAFVPGRSRALAITALG